MVDQHAVVVCVGAERISEEYETEWEERLHMLRNVISIRIRECFCQGL